MGEYTGHIIGAAVSGFLGLLLWTANRGRPILSDDGTLLFRHSIIFRGFSYFFAFVIPFALTAFVFYRPPKTQDDFLAILSLYGLFAVIGLPLWWEASRFALYATPEGLDCVSPWRDRQFFEWGEIEEVSFSSMNQWFVILARGDRKFRVPYFVSGIAQFLERCEQHLPIETLNGAKLGYIQVGREFPTS